MKCIKLTWLVFFIASLISSCDSNTQKGVMDLSGQWRFQIDSLDVGIDGNWASTQLGETINLPGTMDLAGKGDSCTLKPALTKPQVLHLTRKYSYVGPAWYQRDIDITAEMAGKPLELELERVLWQSRLWVDGAEVGNMQESVTTPHRYRIPPLDEGKHTLTLRIDNSKQHDTSFDNLAHAYTNDTQVMWNGVLGRMTLSVVPTISIDRIAVYPDIDTKCVQALINVNSSLDADTTVSIVLDCAGKKVKHDISVSPGDNVVAMTYSMPDDMKLWSEFDPHVYTLSVSIPSTGAYKSTPLGMRSVSTDGDKLLVNGTPVFLRGTLECCIFPLTGTPPTDEAGWGKVFSTAKEYGLNHLRFHSWCPPEAAFSVADKMGFYLQVELPQWSLKVGEDEATTKFIIDEFDRISREYGNHPSLLLMTCGNELQPDFDTLNAIVQHMRDTDPRHLYSASTFTFENGHGKHPEPYDQFFVTQYTDKGWVRGQGIFNSEPPSFDKDYASATDSLGVPLISHEIGQYAVYPNLAEIDKYTGTLTPLNFIAVRDDLTDKGLIDQAADWTTASGKLAAILYKEEIERALKSPGFSGFQLLDLHDFPGQGTALVGLLDAFWDSKGIITPEEFRQFCAPVVALSRFEKAAYRAGESFDANIQLANYSDKALNNIQVSWSITDESGASVAQGKLDADKVAVGGVSDIGDISAKLDTGDKAKRLTFTVAVDGTDIKNTWPIWTYPEIDVADIKQKSENIVVTSDFKQAMTMLDAGKKVLLTPQKDSFTGIEGSFVPVFWSPVHFPDQAGAMGILCDPSHAALAEFPTEMHTNWQWWPLLKQSRFVNLDSLHGVEPIVAVVDNFANNRRLAAIFEAKVGNGRLIFSGIKLDTPDTTMQQRQMLYSLIKYMQSPSFNPSGEMTPDEVLSIKSK